MNDADYQHVIYELRLGKCEWSLRTQLLLRSRQNRQFIKKWLNIKNYISNDFYEAYHLFFITPDALLYHTKNSLIALAAELGRLDIVQLMIENGATYYYRAILNALINRHYEIAKLLIEKGGIQGSLYAYVGYKQILQNLFMDGQTELIQMIKKSR